MGSHTSDMLAERCFEDYEEILRMIDIGVSKHHLDDVFTFVWGNAAFYQLFDYSEKEYQTTYKSLFSYGESKDYDVEPMLSYFHEAYRQCRKSVEYDVYMPIHHKCIWMKVKAAFYKGDDDEVYVYLFYTDIHEIKIKELRATHKMSEFYNHFQWMLSEYGGNVYISDMDTYELLYLNDCACKTLHGEKNTLLGRKCYEVIQGRTSPCPFCTNAYLKEDDVYEWEYYNSILKRTFMVKDKKLNWQGHPARIELSYDMYSTEYKLAKKDQEREALLKTIPAGMVRFDANDMRHILWYNDIFLDMLEYERIQFEEEIHNRCIYMHPDDFKRACKLAQDLKETKDHAVFEIRAYTRSKEERYWTLTLCYVSAQDSWDGIASFYSIGLDITAERKKMESLQHIAKKDGLTGIYNRVEAEKQINDFLAGTSNTGALFMLDIDNFKQINDSKGHMMGDMVLAEMALGMKKIMRDTDIVGRIGGDEFIIFMKNISSKADAQHKAKELLAMFRHLFENDKNKVAITCSIGISLFPKHGHTFKELYAKADKALYQAKEKGKNNDVIFDMETLMKLEGREYHAERTEIDSEKQKTGSFDQLTRNIFHMLYQDEDINDSLNVVLEIVGRKFDVSRAYVFENSEDGMTTSNTYEWCNKGIQPEIANLQNCNFADYGNYEKLFNKDDIFYCRDIHTLVSEQAALFEGQGIHSTLQCAFHQDGIFKGFVGFDECTGFRLWTQEEVEALSLISQVISIFLMRKKARVTYHEMKQYQSLLNRLEDGIYIIEKNTHMLLYANAVFMKHHPDALLNTPYVNEKYNVNRMEIFWHQKKGYLCIEEMTDTKLS